MAGRKAFVVSLIAHGAIFSLLAAGIEFSPFADKKPAMPIEARLIFKRENKKDHLPRKAKPAPPPVAQQQPKKIVEEKKAEAPEPPKEAPLPVAEKLAPPPPTAKKAPAASSKPSSYSKALASLSKAFAEDLAQAKEEEVEQGEVIIDATYFDQIYTLIKESFVVPPHINGPRGKDLQMVVKLFLAADGSLLNIDLVTPSGDDHFDKAVLDGTRRVDNFGVVPPELQNMVKERGIVVELCPFTCKDR